MKLKKVRVKHFRNIIDSTDVEIEDDITCLVGKNESGKTAFLQSLYRLNPVRENIKFSIPDNYPAWLEKDHRLKGINLANEIPISATFSLEEDEIKLIEDVFGTGILIGNEFDLMRNYAGNLSLFLSVNENTLVKHMLANFQFNQNISTELRKSKTIEELHEVIERLHKRVNISDEVKSQLSIIQINIDELIGPDGLKNAIFTYLKDKMPQFFYFDKYSSLPYSVDITKLLRFNESQLNESEITARSLLRLAAADDEYLLNPDYERRKRELENVANSLTKDVLDYWSQNPELRVNPDITLKTVPNAQGHTAVINELKIRIWDNRHLLSLPFNEHSSGFQWFFSFLAAFSEFKFRDTPVVILLDEPALGLHAKAQSDFLRYIEERLSTKNQVIFTTHSPFMVQPDHLERVRIVEDKGRTEGSKITMDVLTTDPDTLFPLQGALGYELAQHLFISPHNLVVEGTSDFSYLSIFSDYLRNELNLTCLDERWSIIPVGGADLIPSFIALLGNHLDVTVLVDSQRAGHQKLSRLATLGYLKQMRIITIGEILNIKFGDIEDLFDEDDYLHLYNLAFSENITKSDLTGSDPIVSRIARYKGINRFDHGKPADYLLRNRDHFLQEISRNTINNFEKLFIRINSTLNTR